MINLTFFGSPAWGWEPRETTPWEGEFTQLKREGYTWEEWDIYLGIDP